MSSYTLTSKQTKNSIVIFILTFIILSVVIDLMLEFYVSKKTTANSYITEKDSKIKHVQFNNLLNTDAIFVGSSRTFYHISTNAFKHSNLDIYNLGVSNSSLQDYSSLIQEAIKYTPKSIIISIEVNELYRQLPLSQYPKLADLKSYFQTMNTSYKVNSTLNWIGNFHSLLRYSESIYLKIVSFYNRFDIKSIVNTNIKPDNQVINYNTKSDCQIFSKKQTGPFITTKCKKGDGILFGSVKDWINIKTIKLVQINTETVKFVNHLINLVEEEGIKPIIILEPVNQFNLQYIYDINYIEENLDAETIDLTQLKTTKEMWVDFRHFNNQGRLYYSHRLSNILKELINE